MKHRFFTALLAMALSAGLLAQENAGEDIMFGVKLPSGTTLSAEASKLLKSKVEQILGRCNAGAAGDRDVFVVEPTVNVGEEVRSEGLVQNVATLSGDLVLAAKNRYDGAVYYSVTVPLKAAGKGSADMEMALVRSIKPTDAVYVRFVRNARKNVATYVAQHPEVLVIPDRPEPEPSVIVVVVPDPAPVPAPAPAVDEPVAVTPAPAPAPVVDTAPEIFCSEPGWQVTVKGCRYDATTRMICFALGIKSTARADRGNLYTVIRSAIDTEGRNYDDFVVDQFYHNYPYEVPVTVNFGIRGVYSNPGTVPFVEVSVGSCKVELRNLSVQ